MWFEVARQAIAPMGELEVASPKDADREMTRRQYDIVIVDSAALKDPVPFVQNLRAQHPRIPILVATLSRSWQRTRAIMRAGATDCILKSMTRDEWASLVANLLEQTKSPEPPLAKEDAHPKPKATILFADNDPAFLATRREFLERAGYTVISASNPTEARQKLEIGEIDLAILDIRLENDDDERDTSGLMLAKSVARATPKIILTNFPTFDYVREALRPQLDGLPVAVDFIMKAEGVPALLSTVEDVLKTVAVQKQGTQPQPKVFIAHGHDSEARETVSAFLKDIGIKPIILFEEADRGETIIEKLERCCQEADFAIVLFTPDDFGYPKEDPRQLKPRARQNVVFELGYMTARLGRRRVRMLYQPDVEIPTNFLSVLYIEMDKSGKWKTYLERELKDAGIPVQAKVQS
jgi:predicted nucleotide-binding protein